jgi:hypothetical protein
MFIRQLGSIELLHVNAQAWHNANISKTKILEKVMQSVLALLKGSRVSLGEASRRLPPNARCLSPVLEPIWHVVHEY